MESTPKGSCVTENRAWYILSTHHGVLVISAVVCFSAETTFSSRRGSAFPNITQQAGQHSELAPPMFYSVQQSGCPLSIL